MHGEYRHLARHRDLALECGVAPGNALMLDDGQPLTLHRSGFELGAKIPAESLLVDGKGVGDVGALVLRERQLLGTAGVVVVSLVLDAKTGTLLHGPVIVSRGFVFTRRFDHVLDDAKCLVLDQLEDRPENDDIARLGDRIRSSMRSFFRKVMGRDPVVLPVITEI
jgi:ribonuclease J